MCIGDNWGFCVGQVVNCDITHHGVIVLIISINCQSNDLISPVAYFTVTATL